MVKLRVAARVIPEDIYIQSLSVTTPTRGLLAGEKKFPIIVREPEEWHIGRLANEIKAAYERLYKRSLGEIKYLKDNEDDCDLDPELYVDDLLVDEGKAAQDGADQHVTIKVIQEQGRAVRQGSLVPDLDRAHYRIPSRPPVPKFGDVPSSLGKRKHDEPHARLNDAGAKRQRMGQIREQDENDVISSIERDGIPESSVGVIENSQSFGARHNHHERYTEIKHESPELPGYSWSNVEPATRDELEFLPQAPAQFRPSPRDGLATTTARRSDSREQSRGRFTATQDVFDRVQRSKSQASSSLARNEQSTRTPEAAVSALNRMTSQSPAQISVTTSRLRRPTKSASDSARKFLGNRRDLYQHPESEIDDTQMSPRSRAKRNGVITPKLVSSARKDLTRPVQNEATPTARQTVQANGDANINSDNVRAPPQESPAISAARASATDEDESSFADTEEVDESDKQGQKTGSNQKTASGSASSVTSASTHSRVDGDKEREHIVAATASREHTDEGLDSPSMQLESEAGMNVKQLTEARRKRQLAMRASLRDVGLSEEEEDVTRLPDSVSDPEMAAARPQKKKRGPRVSNDKTAPPANKLPDGLKRCYSCWINTTRCDNVQPKCAPCERKGCNCQIYSVTKEEAMRVKEERKASKPAGQKSKQVAASKKPSKKEKVKEKPSPLRDGEEVEDGESAEEAEERPVKRKRGPASRVGVQNKGSTPSRATMQTQKPTAKSSSESKPQEAEKALEEQTAESEKVLKMPATDTARNKPPHSKALAVESRQDQSRSSSASDKSQTQSPQLTHQQSVPSSSKESTLPSTATVPKANAVPAQHGQSSHDPSSDVRATPSSQSRVLPPGMSEEEYNRRVAANASMTEAQRQEHKRLVKQNNPVSLKKTISQDSAQHSRKQPQSQSSASDLQPGTTQVANSTKAMSVSSKSGKTTSSIADGTHSYPQILATAVVASTRIPSLTKQPAQNGDIYPRPNTDPNDNNMTTMANNPAFKPQQPKLQKRMAPTTTPPTNPRQPSSSLPKSAANPSSADPFAEAVKPLANMKSVAELRRILSARSTPNAQSGTSSTSMSQQKQQQQRQPVTMKKALSLSDDDEEESEESDDSEEENRVYSSARQTQPERECVNAKIAKARTESESESEETDTESDDD